MSKQETNLYLEDIKECIGKIERYTKGMTREEFLADKKILDAIAWNIEIIGFAASNISSEIKERYEEIPWSGIIDIGDRLMREYFNVDEEALWGEVLVDLPKLKEQIEKIVI